VSAVWKGEFRFLSGILGAMPEDILRLYVSLVPVIVAGVLNTVFCTLPLLRVLEKPLDGNYVMRDGRTVFGPSKTYKGALGYVGLTALCMALWSLASVSQQHNFFYTFHSNTLLYNLSVGGLLGAAWVLCELPNSYLKRRLGIGQSYRLHGAKKLLFTALDQADSMRVGAADRAPRL